MPDTMERASRLVEAVHRLIDEAVQRAGGDTTAIKPEHRIPFHWPPHPVAPSFHVLPSDWSGKATAVFDGEEHTVDVARTPYGVFVRCQEFWTDASGETLDEAIASLALRCEPLLARQRVIAKALGRSGRYTAPIRELAPEDLVALLYCPNRDVANEARLEIETHASSRIFGPALTEILRDVRHPYRRVAQWCVLDLFEDIKSFCPDASSERDAIEAMKGLLWDAPDDYARTIYKAGVVLGGHVSNEPAAAALLACVFAPSRVGRRSAIHASFHLAEWLPHRKAEIVAELRRAATADPEPVLREYAAAIARDIDLGEVDHVMEPVFEGE